MHLPPVVQSSSQLSWCDTRARRMVLRLVSLGYTPSSLAFWPSLGSKTSCRGCPSYTAQPRVPMPSPFVCLTDWGCSCAWGSKLRTIVLLEAFDGRGRSLRSGGAYDSRAARQRGQESDTQFTDRESYSVSCTATRSIHIKLLFLIYRWESRGLRIKGASTMEPSSVLVTPLGFTRAQ